MDQKSTRIEMLIGNSMIHSGERFLSTYQAAQSPGVELAISYESLLYKTMEEVETVFLEELLALETKLLIK